MKKYICNYCNKENYCIRQKVYQEYGKSNIVYVCDYCYKKFQTVKSKGGNDEKRN